MRLTRFRGVDGTIFVIPNGDIRLVGNLSRGWARAIVDFTLPGHERGRHGTVAQRHRRRGARGGDEPRLRRPLHRAAHCCRVAVSRLDHRDDAGDVAHRPVAARRARPEPCARRHSRRWPRPGCGRPRRNPKRRRRPLPAITGDTGVLDPSGQVSGARGGFGRSTASAALPHGLDRRPADPSRAPAGPPPGVPACRAHPPDGRPAAAARPASGSVGARRPGRLRLARHAGAPGPPARVRRPRVRRPPCRTGWR